MTGGSKPLTFHKKCPCCGRELLIDFKVSIEGPAYNPNLDTLYISWSMQLIDIKEKRPTVKEGLVAVIKALQRKEPASATFEEILAEVKSEYKDTFKDSEIMAYVQRLRSDGSIYLPDATHFRRTLSTFNSG